MGSIATNMDAAGRFVIPKELRQALGLEGGGELILSVQDGALIAMTRAEAVRRAQALFTPWQPGEPLASETLIADRRREAADQAGNG
jgi:AbrB family looped-hinge helix DNA binding protein